MVSHSSCPFYNIVRPQDFKTKGKTEAMNLVEKSASDLQTLQTLYAELFPFSKLSDAQADFKAAAASASNMSVNKAVDSTLDQLETATQTLRTLEYFIMLHIPKIEDGGNFGVGVQLDLVKKLGEMQESVKSALEDLLGYQSARAEALGKLNLPSSSTTVTKSSGITTTDGKKEEKASETTEEKQSSSLASGPVYECRLAAVAAVDTLYYSKAKTHFQNCKFGLVQGLVLRSFMHRAIPNTLESLFYRQSGIVGLMSVMDFVDKNREKLLEPKGREGSSSGYSSMY